MMDTLTLTICALLFTLMLKPLARLYWKIRDWFVWRMRDHGEWG